MNQASGTTPDSASAREFNIQADTLYQQDKLAEAERAYDAVLQRDAQNVHAIHRLAVIQLRLEHTERAIEFLKRAIALAPNFADAHCNLGYALESLGRHADAIASYNRAIELKPKFAVAYNNRGLSLQELERKDEAFADFVKATQLDPAYPDAFKNLGNVFLVQGKLEEALRSYERAIEFAPNRGSLYRALVNTGLVKKGNRHIAQMEKLARETGSLPKKEGMELHFALGSLYESFGEPARAFPHFVAANHIMRSQIVYDEAWTLKAFDRMRAVFTKELLTDGPIADEPSELPVFIVGMPRSGTTLVEQVLASHPQIHGAGELPYLPNLANGVGLVDKDVRFPEVFGVAPKEVFQRLGALYLERIRKHSPEAARIVDKLPVNFTRIGVIRMIFPKARIIHVSRDPVETCLSCYAQLFTDKVLYSYDLGELGRYYRGYKKLMEHWRRILPPDAMLDVGYEDVVADLEGQAKRMIAYCGLPWDERCLEFHRHKREVATASAVQVRQPLYGSSVKRWGVFRNHVQPLLDALAD